MRRLLLRWITLATLALYIAIGAVKVIGSILPDDGLIVFAILRTYNFDIAIFDTRTSIIGNLVRHPARDSGLQLSPDNSQLAFISNRRSEIDSLFIVDTDGRNLRQLTFEYVVAYDYMWSPDGSYIAFRLRHDDEQGIYVVDVSSGRVWPIYHQIRETTGHSINQFVWSSDGQSIYAAIYVAIGNGYWQIYRLDAHQLDNHELILEHNSGTLLNSGGRYFLIFNGDVISVWDNITQTSQPLITTVNLGSMPSWSSDNQYLMYVRITEHQSYDLYILDRNGANERLLTTESHISIPRWMFDDNRIMYFSRHPITDETKICSITIVADFQQCFVSPFFAGEFDWLP